MVVVVRLRFLPLPSSLEACDAPRMGSVGPSLERGAVVAGAEGCGAALAEDVEGDAVEGRMSLILVGLGFAGMGGRALVSWGGESGQTASLGLCAVVRWVSASTVFSVRKVFFVGGRQVQDRGIFLAACNCYHCKEVGSSTR